MLSAPSSTPQGSLQVRFAAATLAKADGLAYIDNLQQAISDTRREIEQNELPITREEGEQMDLEAKTWKLLRKLVEARLPADPTTAVAIPPHASEAERVAPLFALPNGPLCEAQLIKNWLEETADPFFPAEIQTGGWINTKAKLEADRAANTVDPNIITELDPDAPYREGKPIHPDDLPWHMAFVRSLYEFMRRGQVAELQAYARACGQHWRVAAILAGSFSTWPLYEDENDPAPSLGERRTLWRAANYGGAKRDRWCPYENALSALLCGDLENHLKICSTWEDAFHAHINSYIECQLQSHLKSPSLGGPEHSHLLQLPQAGNSLTLRKIIDSLSHSSESLIRDGANHPQRLAQASIALNDARAYITSNTQDLLARSDQWASNPLLVDTARFILHLNIACRTLFGSLYDPKKDDVTLIKRYIHHLVGEGNFESAIAYCAQLSTQACADVFGELLAGMSVPTEEKRKYEELAWRYHIDFQAASNHALKIIYDQVATTAYVRMMPSAEYKTMLTTRPLSGESARILSAMEWLSPRVFASTASTTTNRIMWATLFARHFLVTGSLNALAALFRMAPSDTELERARDEDRSLDAYVDDLSLYRKITRLYSTFEEWSEVYFNAPIAPEDRLLRERLEWREKSKKLVEEIFDLTWIILEAGCGCTLEYARGANASSPLLATRYHIRSMYVPQIALLCQEAAYNSRDLRYTYLKKPFELAVLLNQESLGLKDELDAVGVTDEFLRRMALVGLHYNPAVQGSNITDRPE